jgi:hypothetical protein
LVSKARFVTGHLPREGDPANLLLSMALCESVLILGIRLDCGYCVMNREKL